MKLYYGLTNYHLLCSILHKYIYNSSEKAIFVASQGILKSRIEPLRNSNIFDKVYYLEDTNIRDLSFNILNKDSKSEEIENVANNFIPRYEKILPFNINEFEDIYLVADHGVFGIYVLIKKQPYIYFEDGRGIYSNWKILDNLLKIKNPGIRIMSTYYKAYGKSNLIKQRYVSFDSQIDNCDLSNCTNFDINSLLDKISVEQLNKVLNVFDVNKSYNTDKGKKALVLTQRFSTYKMLKEEECIFLYALLCDFFAKNCQIYLKPHPADKCNYNDVFRNEIILDKEMPSELIRFMINNKFDVGISTYSSSINSLKPYIIDIYNIDETIVKFKNNIFKLYVLFELSDSVNGMVVGNKEILESLFQKYYNKTDSVKYIFNYSLKNIGNSIIVSDDNFEGANYIIKIYKKIANKFLSPNLINEYDTLYIKIDDVELIKKIIKFKLSKILPISNVKITAKVECIN